MLLVILLIVNTPISHALQMHLAVSTPRATLPPDVPIRLFVRNIIHRPTSVLSLIPLLVVMDRALITLLCALQPVTLARTVIVYQAQDCAHHHNKYVLLETLVEQGTTQLAC
jgi:hypothetical protein